jgi:hypothetical protein
MPMPRAKINRIMIPLLIACIVAAGVRVNGLFKLVQLSMMTSTTKNSHYDHHDDDGHDDDDNDDHHDDHDHALPTCQELMQQNKPSTDRNSSIDSPFADGSFLTSITTPVVWKRRLDGSGELTLPSTCRLKKYTAREAGQCLKNKNLLFVGDSLTRYQYLSLAYFMEHKKWPPRFQALDPCNRVDEYGNETCSKPNEPNVCAEGDWNKVGGWAPYIQTLGGSTDGGIFHGRMESQSVRTSPYSVENMQYITSEEDGRTKLSLISEVGWFGTERFVGWKFTGCAHNASCRYTPEQYEDNLKRYEADEFDWNYPLITDAFGPNGTLFREQHSDHNYVFYNRGLWGQIQEDKAKKMMESLHNITSTRTRTSIRTGGNEHENQNNRCFFRSTTGCQRTRENDLASWEYGSIRNASYAAGCEYLDIAHLTKEFSTMVYEHEDDEHEEDEDEEFKYTNVFWDSVHYQPWVYEELNNVMLNVLCNAKN